MSDQSELITLYAGPADGREIQLDAEGVEALVLSSCEGSATYRRDNQGVWRFEQRRAHQAVTDDLVLSAAVELFGEQKLARMLALTAMEQAMSGDKFYWSFFAARLNPRFDREDWTS